MSKKPTKLIGLPFSDFNRLVSEKNEVHLQTARLIPFYKPGDEMALTSIFMSALRLIKEFRNFINRGNVVELGVAFVMGASFKSLVDVFTKRLVEPVIGLFLNLPNLENLGLFGDIDPASGINAGSVGAFLGEVINYTIIAFVMFMVIKAYNHFEDVVGDDETEEVASESKEVVLLKEIRDGINNLSTK